MNSHSIISINPISKPAGVEVAKHIVSESVMTVTRPAKVVGSAVKEILGVTGSAAESRVKWAFRVMLGSILMCFGLLFMNFQIMPVSEQVVREISLIMIAGGAAISCGLLTRLVSLGVAIMLAVAASHTAPWSMTGYSMIVCILACITAMILGSGRYSFDTLIYNLHVGRKRRRTDQR